MRKLLPIAVAFFLACSPATSPNDSGSGNPDGSTVTEDGGVKSDAGSTTDAGTFDAGPLVVCGAGPQVNGTLYVDATADWNLSLDGGMGVVGNRISAADLDHDGYPDLVIHAITSNLRQSTEDGGRRLVWLLMNRARPDGGRMFVDATIDSGFFQIRGGSTTQLRSAQLAVFADIDNDGDLDGFSGTNTDPTTPATDPGDRSEVMINDGTGHFSLAAPSAPHPAANERRVANFLAEGVDVLVSTDHEFITDYQPVIDSLGANGVMGSIIGEEVTSFTHGHFNTFPVKRDETAGGNGGAFDHAGGEGPTLRLTELFPKIKSAFGSVVQINHPRGGNGAFSHLKIDTATLASHGLPADFRMAPAPDATAGNTKLFGDGFDALEVANGANLELAIVNDWMTFLSRGTVRTATGVSDSHNALNDTGGYSRTWLRVGVDVPAMMTHALFAEAVKKNRAVISNGPFLKVTAQRVNAAGVAEGPIVEVGDTLKLSPAASEGLELTVDVTAQDWVQFDRIELYSHATGREAVNGEANTSWPEGRILDKKILDPLALTVEPVPGNNGLPLRRVHVVEKFIQRPTKDTWFSVMVRSVGSARTLAPMVDAKPYAMSNAILIDADGSGAYDDFPLKPGQPLSRPPPVVALGPRRVPTAAELEKLLRTLFETK